MTAAFTVVSPDDEQQLPTPRTHVVHACAAPDSHEVALAALHCLDAVAHLPAAFTARATGLIVVQIKSQVWITYSLTLLRCS